METLQDRKAIARYLLARGEDVLEEVVKPVVPTASTRAFLDIPFPDELRSTPQPIDPEPDPNDLCLRQMWSSSPNRSNASDR